MEREDIYPNIVLMEKLEEMGLIPPHATEVTIAIRPLCRPTLTVTCVVGEELLPFVEDLKDKHLQVTVQGVDEQPHRATGHGP